MTDSTTTIVTVYFYAAPSLSQTWLKDGIHPTDGGLSVGPPFTYVQGWLTTERDSAIPGFAWVAAAMPSDRVSVADGDLYVAAMLMAGAPEPFQIDYERSITPVTLYRFGEFRRPHALIQGRITPDLLTPLPAPDPTPYHGAEYARQLHQALRVMIGAPPDTPLEALVAAAVARGRARYVLTLHHTPKVYLYAVDNGAWRFTFDTLFSHVTALPRQGYRRLP